MGYFKPILHIFFLLNIKKDLFILHYFKTNNYFCLNLSRSNQSYSFRMLNRWIEESENNADKLMVSKKDEELAQSNSEKPKFLSSAGYINNN